MKFGCVFYGDKIILIIWFFFVIVNIEVRICIYDDFGRVFLGII